MSLQSGIREKPAGLKALPPPLYHRFEDLTPETKTAKAAGVPQSPFTDENQAIELEDRLKKARFHLEFLRYGHFNYHGLEDMIGPILDKKRKEDWQKKLDEISKRLRDSLCTKDCL